MKARFREIIPLRGGEWVISFTTPENPGKLFDKLREKLLNVEIKEASKIRSRDANAMCWSLCSDIGKAITPPLSKEEVYRRAIKAVGVYSPVTVVEWDLDTIMKRWSSNGIGWFVEVVDQAGIGRKLIHLYYGSSTYSVEEMRVLLDWLIDEAEQMDIRIPLSKENEERLLETWGKASSRK